MADHDSPLRSWALVGVGVLGVSLSGPIASVVAVPAIAVAFYRTALGALATAPVAAARGGLRSRMPFADLCGSALAGLLLAVHFGTWIPSLRMTSVATATALVAVSPVWIVLTDRLLGRRVPPGVVGGVLLATLGVVLVTGVDAGSSGRALAGDLLALAGSVAGAGYVMVGERVRRTSPTAVYTTVAYGTCALALAPVCLAFGVPLAGWDSRAWAEIAVLTVAAQLLGHTALNAALPAVGATPLSLAILLEVPGATLVAWAWLGQEPPMVRYLAS